MALPRTVWFWVSLLAIPASCTVVANGHLSDKPLEGEGGDGGTGGVVDGEGGEVETPKQPSGTPCSDHMECASGSCTDGVCCDQACVGGCVTCSLLGLYGVCTPLTGEVGDCMNGQLCGADGECTNVDGGGCLTNADCTTAPSICQDGVCCNELCDGKCESCVESDTGSASGICAGTPKTDPEGDCGAESCAGKGLCCGEAVPPPAGSCPSVCTGECEDGVCTILCDEKDLCSSANIVCPAGFDCRIECVEEHACKDAAIDCPPDHECDVVCDGKHACENALITCTNGPCSVLCEEEADKPCELDVVVVCGTNACDITCDGDKPTMVECGESCRCNTCPP